jgi:signal transduction histidine kinase
MKCEEDCDVKFTDANKVILFAVLYTLLAAMLLIGSHYVDTKYDIYLIIGGLLLGPVLFSLFLYRPMMACRQRSQILKQIFEHSPMGIMIRTAGGDILRSSKSFEDVFSLTNTQMSRIVRKSYNNQWSNAFREIEKDLANGSYMVKREFKFMDSKGQDVFTTLSFPVTLVDRHPDDYVYVTFAINSKDDYLIREELKELELNSRKAAEAKTTFLATMSHEIRTPLTSIIGFLDLLGETSLDADQEKFLNIASDSSSSLLVLINDILDYSKIEQKDFRLEHTSFSILRLFEEMRKSFEFQAAEKKLHFKYEIDPKVSEFFDADIVRMRQILVNLLGNAIKFTSEGYVKLEVRHIRSNWEYQKLQIIVSDSGIGLKEDQLENIFDRFSQADSSIGRKYGGTGLGLSITKKLVEMMDGEIKVDSVYGEGAIFTIELKLNLTQKPESIPTDMKRLNNKSFLGKRVLVVDDEQSNRKLVQLQLSKLGVHADFVENGREAVEIVKENDPYDIILMDIQMPDIDGVQALKEIRAYEKDNNLRLTPIYAFTANVFREQLKDYHEQGFDGHLTKPFQKVDLYKFLSIYLK